MTVVDWVIITLSVAFVIFQALRPMRPAMTAPKRVQMSRQYPWRAGNPDAVIVARPSRWGNPCHWYPRPSVEFTATGMTRHPADPAAARAISVQGFREQLSDPDARAFNGYPSDAEIRAALAGLDLACWCPLDQACHADVLLEIANEVLP